MHWVLVTNEMKKLILIIVFIIFCGVLIFLLFARVNSAMEIDNLKEEIKHQRREMHFLENITNSTLSPCKTTVSDFENVVRANGNNVLWQGDDALVGAFKIKRKGSCLVSINAVDGL